MLYDYNIEIFGSIININLKKTYKIGFFVIPKIFIKII